MFWLTSLELKIFSSGSEQIIANHLSHVYEEGSSEAGLVNL